MRSMLAAFAASIAFVVSTSIITHSSLSSSVCLETSVRSRERAGALGVFVTTISIRVRVLGFGAGAAAFGGFGALTTIIRGRVIMNSAGAGAGGGALSPNSKNCLPWVLTRT